MLICDDCGRAVNSYRCIHCNDIRKLYYDRHRRIRKRLKFGGCYISGCWMPEIKRTWGEVFIAKTKAKEITKFFNQLGD